MISLKRNSRGELVEATGRRATEKTIYNIKNQNLNNYNNSAIMCRMYKMQRDTATSIAIEDYYNTHIYINKFFEYNR